MSDTKTESIVSSAEADDEGATDAQQVSAPMDYKPPPRFVMWHRRYRPQWAERGTVSVPLSCGHEWMFKDDAPVAEIDCEYCAKKCAVPAGMGKRAASDFGGPSQPRGDGDAKVAADADDTSDEDEYVMPGAWEIRSYCIRAGSVRGKGEYLVNPHEDNVRCWGGYQARAILGTREQAGQWASLFRYARVVRVLRKPTFGTQCQAVRRKSVAEAGDG